jgi:hypothetical protein
MTYFSPHQNTFFAYQITLMGLREEAFAQSLSTARVNVTTILARLLTKELTARGFHCSPVACPYSVSAIASEVVA